MRRLTDLPLKRQLTLIILITCTVALSLACAALAVYEALDFRRAMARDMTVLADVLAKNTQAALAFDDADAAGALLRALQADPHVVAARVFNRGGEPFANYTRPGSAPELPARSASDEPRFANGHLALFRPITLDGKAVGTIYLLVDLQEMYDRLALFAGISGLVLVGSFLLALALSTRLQGLVSKPIMALAEITRAVAERGDYTLRAPPQGGNELGRLSDGFNHMLARIHDQNQTLKEGEERVRAVLDSALSAVVVIDAQGRISDWNPRAEAMFGRTRAEVLGQELAGLIVPPQHREAHRRGLERFAASGKSVVMNRLVEMSALRRDGGEFPVELSISPLKAGAAMSFCGFITDITERKRMEESRRQLAAIVESSDDAIISKSIDGIISTWNPGAEKLFGFPAAEAIGRPMLICIPPEQADEEAVILKRIMRGESLDHFDTVRLRKDGKRIEVSITVSPIRDAGGAIVGASKIARDISERKQAEGRLQAQLARLNLLNQITRGIGDRLDLASIFQVVIRSLEDNLAIDFGCVGLYDPLAGALTISNVGAHSETLAQSLGMPQQAVIPIDQNGLSHCVAGKLVYEPDVSQIRFPFPQRLAGGGLRALVAAPLMVESKVFGVLVVARRQADSFSSGECEFLRQLGEHVALAAHQSQLYTALQQAFDDLRHSQQAAMQQERLSALGQMASGIAHDINNAISPVALYTESLLEREPNLSPRARSYLETIAGAIDDVAATVARMREFYRQREPQLTLAPLQLNRLVQQVIDLTRARWSDMPQQRGVVITMDNQCAPDLPTTMGVESEIREALTNLVFNAVDAMPEGGTLTLRTRTTQPPPNAHGAFAPEHVHVEVSDTGIGMDETTRQRCLEPFFTTKGERGTGLGLAMVYGMVQRHSAEIAIESAIGKGTTVRLSFPVSAIITEPGKVTKARAVPTNLRILVVDDDPLLLKSLHDTLTIDGHTVVTANGGQAGIDLFRSAHGGKEPFAVVITDLGMPYVDGRKVATAIKITSPSTPVLLLTGWGQRLVAEGDIPPHVDRVLSKPPKLNDLRTALAEHCPPAGS